MPEENYGAQNIQVLEGLDAVRKRLVCTLVVRPFAVYITSFMK